MRAELMQAIDDTAAAFCDLLRTIDPDEATRPVEGLDWTVGDVAAHVLTVARRGTGDLRRSASADGTAELNELCLRETRERDPRTIAELLEKEVRLALDVIWPRISDDREIPFHAGMTTTMVPACSIVLGEYLVHGWDIANAVGRPWTIDPAHVAILGRGSALLARGWIAPGGPDETFLVRTPAGTVLYRFHDGAVDVEHGANGPADHEIVADDPVELLLTFPYRRLPATDPALRRLLDRFSSA